MEMKKVALVTGGSRGIGYGIAKQLVNIGFDVAINGVRDEASLGDVLTSLRSSGAEVLYCQGDLSSSSDRKKIVQRVKDHFRRLNVLAKNAGVAPKERRDILEATEESFDHVISTNLKGTYFLTQLAANGMIQQKQLDPDFT